MSSFFSGMKNQVIDVLTNHTLFTFYFVFITVALCYLVLSLVLFKENQTKRILTQNIKTSGETVKKKNGLVEFIEQMFSKREEKIAFELERANVLFTPQEYKNMMMAGAIGLGLIGFSFFPLSVVWKSLFIWFPIPIMQDIFGRLLCTFVLGYGGSYIPKLWIELLIQKRKKILSVQIRESLESIADNLKAGMILKQAIKNVGDELPYPIGDEYQRVYQEMETGKTFDEAIESMSERVNLNDFKLAVSAMQIQTEAGGELEPLLRNMAVLIQQRNELKKEIEKTISAAKTTGIVLMVAPIFFLIVFTMLNKEMYVEMLQLWQGKAMIALGVLFYIIAAWLIVLIIKNAMKDV